MFGGARSYSLGPSLTFQFEAVAPQLTGVAYTPAVAKFGGSGGSGGAQTPASNPFSARTQSTASAVKKPGGGGVVGGKSAQTKRAPPTREGYLEKIVSGKGK